MMQRKILNEKITCVTFWTHTLVERDEWSEEMHIFDEKIHLMYGPKVSDDDLCAIKATTPEYDKVKEGLVMPNTDFFDTEGYDGYIASQVLLPKRDEYQFGKIKSCKKDEKAILLDAQIQISFWTPDYMRWNLMMEKCMSMQQT